MRLCEVQVNTLEVGQLDNRFQVSSFKSENQTTTKLHNSSVETMGGLHAL